MFALRAFLGWKEGAHLLQQTAGTRVGWDASAGLGMANLPALALLFYASPIASSSSSVRQHYLGGGRTHSARAQQAPFSPPTHLCLWVTTMPCSLLHLSSTSGRSDAA